MSLSDDHVSPSSALENLQANSKNEVRYYATSELAWRVSGQFTVVTLHQGDSRDITLVSGDLLAGGYQGTLHMQGEMGGTEDFGLDLSKWEDRFLEPVSQLTATRFIWGIFAFSMRQHTLDLEDFPDGPALGLLPPPRGKAFDWQRGLFKPLDAQCVGVAKEACDNIDLELPPAERQAWPVAVLVTYKKVPGDFLAILKKTGDEFSPAPQAAGLHETGFWWTDPRADGPSRITVYLSQGQLVTMAPDAQAATDIAMRLKTLAPELSCTPTVRWIPHKELYARRAARHEVMQGLPARDLRGTMPN